MRMMAGVLAWILLVAVACGAAARTKPADLPVEFREWLEEVDVLLTKEERKAFLALDKDYQRTAFVKQFWASRDSSPQSEQNEFRERFYARLEEASERFGNDVDGRFRVFLLNGEPGEIFDTSCGLLTWPLEVWRYAYSPRVGRGFQVIFYQPSGGGPFRTWRPAEGYEVLLALSTAGGADFYNVLASGCTELEDEIYDLLSSFQAVEREGRAGTTVAETAPAPQDDEWLLSFRAASTEAPEDGVALSGELEMTYPRRHQNRTVVEGWLHLDAAQLTRADLIDGEGYSLLLTGEILRLGELFETFRYEYHLPVLASAQERLDLSFERYLRPGGYELTLKVDDLSSSGYLRIVEPFEVPSVAGGEVTTGADIEAEDDSVPAASAASIRVSTDETDLRSGLTRFSASTTGDDIRKVTFFLEDKPVLTKTRPPFSVELDLGDLPLERTLRVVAFDRAGNALATDETVINPGRHAFTLRLVEPRAEADISTSLRVRVEAEAPEGARVDRVELFVNETRVATLFQPPYVQSLPAPGGDTPFYLRAVGYLEDGNATEDLVLLNTSGYSEDVRVRLVELYVSVLDRAGRPVRELTEEAFSLRESGEPQEIVRFEEIDDLPIYVSLLVDTSASMEPQLETVRAAARQFFEQTITPKDRASLITFSDQPRLAAGFTADLSVLGSALAGLRAERSTAVYDSAIFALDFFKGLKGQKALLLLTDGKDRRSEYTFEQALEFSQHSEVAIYTIGLGVSGASRQSRGRLTELAEATGGRSFFINTADELAAVYQQIESDLRSRYFLVYRSPPGDDEAFRRIEVQVEGTGLEAVARAGYYP